MTKPERILRFSSAPLHLFILGVLLAGMAVGTGGSRQYEDTPTGLVAMIFGVLGLLCVWAGLLLSRACAKARRRLLPGRLDGRLPNGLPATPLNTYIYAPESPLSQVPWFGGSSLTDPPTDVIGVVLLRRHATEPDGIVAGVVLADKDPSAVNEVAGALGHLGYTLMRSTACPDTSNLN